MFLKYAGIRVTDLEKSLDFYTRLLGLKEERRGQGYLEGDQGVKSVWVLLKDDASGQYLELNWYPPGHVYAVPYSPGEGLDHLGFVVEDVRRTFNELVAQGAEATQTTPDITMGWTAYLKDPDGNWIEIFQLEEPKSAPGTE